ncbi:G-protein coupled receptor Mth2 [Operophtera brumata]|uniref:G-protein coupled receptor Mth2 n=1 Tax=Operophtera brumata TaxID=104452 RepID=A0A0L7L3F9_OPEBR|nr:G-protein coupled receptor Mth2 [Operophtera brumata]
MLFAMSSFNLWRQTIKYDVNKLNNLKHKKIMDTFNCLQGVVIFLLLVVFRRRAVQGLAQENCCLPLTRPLAEKLSPHDDLDDQQILAEDTTEVRLN